MVFSSQEVVHFASVTIGPNWRTERRSWNVSPKDSLQVQVATSSLLFFSYVFATSLFRALGVGYFVINFRFEFLGCVPCSWV